MNTKRRTILGIAALSPLMGYALTSNRVNAHYPDERLAQLKSFTLPRTFLYNPKGELITQTAWPANLLKVKEFAGDAFCCVSDKPAPAGSLGPPPDCKIIVYGEDVSENFNGLIGPDSKPITYANLPKSKFLLAEYFASWCPPCIPGQRNLEALFNNERVASEYTWLSIDMTRLIEAQKAARTKKH